MRLIIISNRLPYTVVDDGVEFTFQDSIGGLVSSLSGYIDHLPRSPGPISEAIWVGWPGISVVPERQAKLKASMLATFRAVPVFLDEPVMDEFYHGFCNKTLWPLFHYFPSYTNYDEASWDVYQLVNERFCVEVSALIEPGDIVWVHDYHLLLLPALLRQMHPATPIGFFLHIPFPTYEVYRMLPSPWRTAILDGLLGADLIGLHTPDDADYLRTSMARLRATPLTDDCVHHGDRAVIVRAFPISIDVERFSSAAELPEVVSEIEHLRDRLADWKVIISVDRLDYSKGILQRLRGYHTFLEQNPDWHGQVTFILVVVPSRIGVDQYQRMRQQIEEAVGHINGRYGSIHWTPIVYQYRVLSFESLMALYTVGDVALITPLRDGMNLVAKEYVVARRDQTGVLILSEMTGAAHELREALIINPNHRSDIALAIAAALTMPYAEQIERMAAMQAHVAKHDVLRWASEFLETLTGDQTVARGKG